MAMKFAEHSSVDYIDLTVFPQGQPSGQTLDFQNKKKLFNVYSPTENKCYKVLHIKQITG